MSQFVSPLKKPNGRFDFRDYLPAFAWLRDYDREAFTSDLIAGGIVAIMLVPQGMAYALLAGLPPQVGLYASILPLVIYGLLGSSRSLAVGPVAMVSLLVASSIGPLTSNTSDYIALAITLAFIVGLMQTGMGILRVGFVVNFLSHPVLSAFTSAAAIIIGFSQLKHMLGFSVPRFEHFYEQVIYTASHLSQTNSIALAVGAGGMLLLWLCKRYLARGLAYLRLPEALVLPLSKMGPLFIVILGIAMTMLLGLDIRFGLNIVGDVPVGLPGLSRPLFDFAVWQQLLPAAIAISLVGYMESVSVAKALASKRREKIDPNQELFALGLANLGATFTGGYPVTGGISRSVVNFSAGARTGMASIITAVLVALTTLFLTPLFYYLPKAILAAIILVAIINMIDFGTLVSVWRYNRADGIAWLITFGAVLWVGVEMGILYGAAVSIGLFVWRTSQPHIAVVGRLPNSELYRNVLRHDVTTWPGVTLMRIDQSLYFANTKALETAVLGLVADNPEVEHFILIGTAINFIDASAIETLEELHESLESAGVEFHLAAIKGPVMDQLKKTDFAEKLGDHHIHLSTHQAMQTLGYIEK